MKNWRTKIKQMLTEKKSQEEIYYFLHKEINKDFPTFYDTITSSKEWEEWEKVALKKGYDVVESRETGWFSSRHFKAFIRFIKR